MLYAKMMNNVILPVVDCNENTIIFQTVVNDNGAIGFITATVGSDDSAIVNIDVKSCGITLVNIEMTSDTEGTADKSFAALREAANAGIPIYANIIGMIVPAHSVSETDITFNVRLPAEEGLYANVMVTLSDSDTVSANVQMEGGSIVYVTVSGNGNTCSADMTPSEIFAAYSMGKTVVCKTNIGVLDNCLLPITFCTENASLFTGFLDTTGAGLPRKQLCSVMIGNDDILKYQSDMNKFVNPYSLKINGTEYDGSKAVTINIEVPTKLSDLGDDENHRVVTDAEKEAWNAKSDFSGDYNNLSNKPAIPSNLSDLTDDATHRTVTDAEKSAWNTKSTFSGSYNDLTDKPIIPSISGLATENYVDTKVAGLVDSAPGTLDTLNELAVALGKDPNFATTVTTQISEKVDKTTTINGHALNANIILSASDVGALENTTTLSSFENDVGYLTQEQNSNLINGSATGSLRTINSLEENFYYTIGDYAIAEGYTKSPGVYSHAEGYASAAFGRASHAENSGIAIGDCSHAEGYYTVSYQNGSHAEGYHTIAYGQASHAEGEGNIFDIEITGEANSKIYTYSFDGDKNLLLGAGKKLIVNTAYGESKVAIINSIDESTITLNNTLSSTRSFNNQHCDLYITCLANGRCSHAEGSSTQALGMGSHSEGQYTIAEEAYQHVQGKYNVSKIHNFAHIVGNGNDEDNRSNAHTLDWDGNAWFAGDVYVGSTSGTNKDEGSKKLATEDFVSNAISAIPTPDVSGQIAEAMNELRQEILGGEW